MWQWIEGEHLQLTCVQELQAQRGCTVSCSSLVSDSRKPTRGLKKEHRFQSWPGKEARRFLLGERTPRPETRRARFLKASGAKPQTEKSLRPSLSQCRSLKTNWPLLSEGLYSILCRSLMTTIAKMTLVALIPQGTQNPYSSPVVKRATGAVKNAKHPTRTSTQAIPDARALSTSRVSILLLGGPSLLVFVRYNERAQAFV